MCGIYGFTRNNMSEIEAKSRLDKMGHLLEHRGPDGIGDFIDEDFALGHRSFEYH